MKRSLWSGDHGVITRAALRSTKRSGLNAEALHLEVECLVVDPKKSSRLALVSAGGLQGQTNRLPLRVEDGKFGELLQ